MPITADTITVAQFLEAEANIDSVLAANVSASAECIFATPTGENDQSLVYTQLTQYIAGAAGDQQVVGSAAGLNLGTGVILSANFAAGAVDTTAIADNAVTTAKILDANVTASKLNIDKITNWISVLDHGADNTGAADSRTAIVDAINAAYTASAAVYMPAGTYRIDSPIQLNVENTIIGEPGRTIIQAFGSVPGDEFTMMKRGSADCSLEMYGIVMRHNGQISGAPVFGDSNAVDLNRAIKVSIDRCEFWNCPNACMTLRHELGTPLPDITVTRSFGGMDNGDVGALFLDVDNCKSVVATANSTDSIARSFSMEQTDAVNHIADNITIVGNNFRNGALATISTTNTCIPILLNVKGGVSITQATIVGNTISDCTNTGASQGYAIMLKGSTDNLTFIKNVSVVGNVVDNWNGNGSSHVFFLKDISHFSFLGNVCNDPTWSATTEAGLYLEHCENGSVSGNVWTGSYDPAVIQTSATAGANSRVTISDNTVPAAQRFISGVGAGFLVTHAGNGSPESGMHADVGSIYQRLDGSSGSVCYIKETGTFDTGWEAVATTVTSRKAGVDDLGTQSGSTYTVTWTAGTYDNKELTMGSNIALTFSTATNGRYVLRVRQDGTGGRTATIAAGTDLQPPVTTLPLDTDAGALTIFNFEYDATDDVWHWG